MQTLILHLLAVGNMLCYLAVKQIALSQENKKGNGAIRFTSSWPINCYCGMSAVVDDEVQQP